MNEKRSALLTKYGCEASDFHLRNSPCPHWQYQLKALLPSASTAVHCLHICASTWTPSGISSGLSRKIRKHQKTPNQNNKMNPSNYWQQYCPGTPDGHGMARIRGSRRRGWPGQDCPKLPIAELLLLPKCRLVAGAGAAALWFARLELPVLPAQGLACWSWLGKIPMWPGVERIREGWALCPEMSSWLLLAKAPPKSHTVKFPH